MRRRRTPASIAELSKKPKVLDLNFEEIVCPKCGEKYDFYLLDTEIVRVTKTPFSKVGQASDLAVHICKVYCGKCETEITDKMWSQCRHCKSSEKMQTFAKKVRVFRSSVPRKV